MLYRYKHLMMSRLKSMRFLLQVHKPRQQLMTPARNVRIDKDSLYLYTLILRVVVPAEYVGVPLQLTA